MTILLNTIMTVSVKTEYTGKLQFSSYAQTCPNVISKRFQKQTDIVEARASIYGENVLGVLKFTSPYFLGKYVTENFGSRVIIYAGVVILCHELLQQNATRNYGTY